MKSIDIANGIIFQKLNISIDSFDERIISQKKIYLLQQLGTDLGYIYNWYLKGPYSPSLTSYLYNKLEILSETDFSSYSLAQKPRENVDKVNLLGRCKMTELSLSSWYELLASLMYICANKESWGVSDKNSIIQLLIKYKPQYNKSQCEYALTKLVEKGFNLAGI